MNARELLKAWLPAGLWLLVIFVASTDLGSGEHTAGFLVPLLRWFNPDISAGSIETAHFLVRKSAHLLAYAILATLFWRAFALTFIRQLLPNRALIVLLIAVSYAAFDEFHQSFVPTRTPSAHDVLIDGCGAAIAIGFCWVWRGRSAAT